MPHISPEHLGRYARAPQTPWQNTHITVARWQHEHRNRHTLGHEPLQLVLLEDVAGNLALAVPLGSIHVENA